MRFQSFLKESKKQRCKVEKRKKRKAYELSNPSAKPVRKKIRVPNQSQIQEPSPLYSLLHPSSLSLSAPPSSSSPSKHPSSSSHNWTHDVFPSFRGEDVRRDFLSHIQKELKRKVITPFNDNGIKRGESIGPELISAIRGSKIAIILLSKNYASSKWCLDELVEIIKCKEELGQTVMPVFYEVDPSDVKKQTGDFGEGFRKTCLGKAKEDIESWRQALEKVATIAGYHSSNWDNEAFMIEKIATDISNELINSVPSSDFDNFVGMRAHMENLEPLLHLDSDEVRMIGIWGPSGIGKTTIARVLRSKYSHQFQCSVFMESIRRRYPRPCFDEYLAKLQLQREFLSQIINQKDLEISHLGVAQNRLKDKRVLVVLDDADELAQLDAMAKETWWFGPGSRIIVTTQDKKILNAHGINHVYEVGFPANDEALEIFCMYAFGQKSPYDGFEKLAWIVTRLAGNLPLGLRVMGSFFKGMSKKDWEEELPRLRTRLDGDIESILKFSYDALCDDAQALFLHIACFFNGELIERVEAYLSASFVGVKGLLRVLAEKSLISFNYPGYIKMHDLLERLGREIVRKQSPSDPGQRHFLVDARDICQVLCNDSVGSRSVIGIDMKGMELQISDGAFEKMYNVQFLRLRISGALNFLPPKLRFLHWERSPMTCLPSSFNPEFLVEINMADNNNLEKLWEGNKTIRNLKWMYLGNSSNLKELPDLSTATNLRTLDLSNCSSLVELPSSVGDMTNLEKLHLNECSSLVELPSSIGNLHKLRELDLKGCSKLKALPININMRSLDVVDLTGCSLLESFPEISTNIRILRVNRTAMKEIPLSIRSWSRLCTLDMSYCENLWESCHAFDRITKLNLCDTGIQKIAPWIKKMTRLERLVIKRCTKLVSLPQLPDSLKFLNADNCESLEKLDFDCSFSKIKFDKLSFVNCSKLNQEARDLLIKTEGCVVIFPGEKVPTYFTYRASGSSVSMEWNESVTRFTTFLSLKACVLLVYKGDDVWTRGWNFHSISYCIRDKQSGVIVNSGRSDSMYGSYCLSRYSKEHLFVFEFEITVSSAELVFEFEFSNEIWVSKDDVKKSWEIKECGLRLLETLPPHVVPSC